MHKVKRLKNKKLSVSGWVATLPLQLSVFAYKGTPDDFARDMVWAAGRINKIISRDLLLTAMLSKICGDESGSLMVGEPDDLTAESVKIEEF